MELALVYCSCVYYESDYFMIQIFTTVAFSKAHERRFEFIPSGERNLLQRS